ncbi:MAG: crotonase/enoyl-CoA hydratase family protein [Frankiaceae bacterium]
MSESVVTVDRREHLLLIGLNRPDKRNAVNLAMLEAMSRAYGRLEDDDEVWCAVVFAHGRDFTTGLDLAEVGPAVAQGAPLFPEGGVDPVGLHGRVRTKPVVMAVQGWCLTLGIELLLASDVRIAASDTRFAQIEVKRGIYPFGGATFRMPRQFGWGNAMRYLLTGDEFDAAEAYRIGLVQEVVPPGEQLGKAMEIAGRIASVAPLGVQATLRSAWLAAAGEEEAAKSRLYADAGRLFASEDAREGVTSFIERRTAVFKGR